RWWCRRQWRRRCRRCAKLHRHAGEDVVRMIAGAVLAAAATVGPPVAVRKRDPSRVVEGWIGGPQVTIVEIEGDRWAKVVADTRDCLVPELPAAALQDGAAEGLRQRNKSRWRLKNSRRQGADRRAVERHAVNDVHRADACPDVWTDRPANREVIDHVGHDRMRSALAVKASATRG